MPYEAIISEAAAQFKTTTCEDCNNLPASPARYWNGAEIVVRVLCQRCHCNRMVTGQDDLYRRMIEHEQKIGLGLT